MIASVLVMVGIGVVHSMLRVTVCWSLLVALGGRATAVAFGTPRLIAWRRGDTEISFGPFPNGGVSILGCLQDGPISDPRDWRNLTLTRRLLVLVLPWLLGLMIAVACLGPGRALTSVIHGLYQLVLVLDLTPLVRRMLAIVAVSPLHVTAGVMFAKAAAVDLVPLFGFEAGGWLREISSSTRSRGLPRGRWMLLGVLAGLFILGRVVYALVRVLLG
jgi:hypothetical protein